MYVLESILIIILVFIYFFIWYVAKNRSNIFLNNFTDKIIIIGSMFVPISIYLTYRVFTLQTQEMHILATFRMIDRGLLEIDKSMVDYYDKCPTFINSLYFDWQKKILGKEIYHSDNNEMTTVNLICMRIFQSWEDFLTTANSDCTEKNAWIASYIQWANSDLLRNYWKVLKFNFGHFTQEFGDYLFLMVHLHKNKLRNPTEAQNLADSISNSETLNTILYNRHKNDRYF